MERERAAVSRRLPIGAETIEGGVHFRVWAPKCKRVEVVLEGGPGAGITRLIAPEGNGYFSGMVERPANGTLYRLRLDERSKLFPDPASRFQPEGPFGPSQVIDPNQFRWTDNSWSGVIAADQVIYEMHIGTFTREGTWESASRELPNLADIGITLLEIMPIADFAGQFGWGYDGVNLFAPTRLYGEPDDFRRFVDKAHSLGIGVLLDVVYNHVGGVGNFLEEFTDAFFSKKYITDWGKAVNLDQEDSGPVREFYITNAGYWIEEFHVDGLRLDAVHSIFDQSSPHILAAIAHRVRAAAGDRATFIVAESELQNAILVKPPQEGGYGLDAMWNDDFHHTAMVALTGHNQGYYTGYLGTPQELISSIKRGFLYQGQHHKWHNKRRGTPSLDLDPARFIVCLQNHDQIANSAYGLRCHFLTSPGRYKALTALLLLAPETPMLFQGQEFAASNPFTYFCDMPDDIAPSIYDSRIKFLHRFQSLAQPEMQTHFPHPGDPDTFYRCKLDFSERERHASIYALHRDLLKIRREDPVFHTGGVDGAVLGHQAFLLRFFGDRGDDRLMLVNLGRDLEFSPAPEPLLAPPEGRHWELMWSSEDPAYSGSGTPPPEDEGIWRILGEATAMLKAVVTGKPAPRK